MKTLPKTGDVVSVRQGRYTVRALVLETYQSPIGHRVTIQVPVDPRPGDEISTFSYDLEDLLESV